MNWFLTWIDLCSTFCQICLSPPVFGHRGDSVPRTAARVLSRGHFLPWSQVSVPGQAMRPHWKMHPHSESSLPTLPSKASFSNPRSDRGPHTVLSYPLTMRLCEVSERVANTAQSSHTPFTQLPLPWNTHLGTTVPTAGFIQLSPMSLFWSTIPTCHSHVLCPCSLQSLTQFLCLSLSFIALRLLERRGQLFGGRSFIWVCLLCSPD